MFFTILLISMGLHAQTTTVEFRVNMNHYSNTNLFFPSTEFVDIAGTFNNWGNPGLLLDDSDGDGIYVATTTLNVGAVVEFKARINGEWLGREEFTGGGPNRVYTVQANGIVEFWYNDEISPDVLYPIFTASTRVAEPGEQIQLNDASTGNPTFWEWRFVGATIAISNAQNPIVSYTQEGIYPIELKVANANGDTISRYFENAIRIDDKNLHWWNDAVFYEVFVRSFKDSDSDGIGDIRGLINKLDYLNDGDSTTHQDLGINGIWLMPVAQSPSYHGYDVFDYNTIEQDYGTNADFQELMQEAHARGIKVIVDMVLNHSSSSHPWFIASKDTASPYREYYVWNNNPPNMVGPWGQQLWYANSGSYYYGLFWSGMPDLNFESQNMKNELLDIAEFWLTDMQVDGFRLDAAKYLAEVDSTILEDAPGTFEFWQSYNQHIKSINPESFTVGEVWSPINKVIPYVNDSTLDYCFEFNIAYSIANSVNGRNKEFVTNAVEDAMLNYPYLQFGTFLTNHDMDRVMSVFQNNVAKNKIAADLYLTLPGIPYLYYGEEIGMLGVKPDPDIRTPMQWDDSFYAGFSNAVPYKAVNPDYTWKNVAAQTNDASSLLNHYRDLITIRNTQSVLKRGDITFLETNSTQVVAYLRAYQNEQILVVTNLGTNNLAPVLLKVPSSKLPSGPFVFHDLRLGTDLQIQVNPGATNTELVVDIVAQSSYIAKIQAPNSVEHQQQKELAALVYPTIAQNEIFIEAEFPQTNTNYSISIVDVLGKVVYSGGPKTSSGYLLRERLNIHNLNTGWYTVRIESNIGTITKRFYKQQ